MFKKQSPQSSPKSEKSPKHQTPKIIESDSPESSNSTTKIEEKPSCTVLDQ